MSTVNPKSDIVIAIRPQHVKNIASRAKDHEFRRYLIPNHVKRIWIYETKPTSSITYVATISPGKRPGEISNQDGLKNREFNEGVLSSRATYAYEILSWRELEQPLTLRDLTSNGWLGGPPQKYCYIKDNMMMALRARSTSLIFTIAGSPDDSAADEVALQQTTVNSSGTEAIESM